MGEFMELILHLHWIISPKIILNIIKKIDKNDRAAHGIRVISDKVELENWVFENL